CARYGPLLLYYAMDYW
nr:immunoglobulin heavy chain junction region [Mus musculus]MBK4197752.1 immunoglobulin heavy chain junction region [Mus musculus]MBK4197753.1 immunoglobulin heavy chain junction region [Mus musculus]